MTNTYNVHIYREMRLVYGGIEADSHEAAASIARDKPTDQADSIDDCDGETLAALVDVQGDEDYAQSRIVDFESERERRAAPKLLAALKAFIEADALAEECGEWKWENLEHAFELARGAIAEADASGIAVAPPAPAADAHNCHSGRRVSKLHYAIRHDGGMEERLYWEVSGTGRPYEDAVNELLDFYRTVESERVIFVEALK
jgi:hypothetical protein